MLVHRTKKFLVRSTSVGSDISYFHTQTELPDLGLLYFAKALKGVEISRLTG